MPMHDTSADVKIDAGGELAKAATEESTHVPRDERDGELQALRAKLAAAERSCAQLVEECEINARHHAVAIADLKKKHDNAMLELKRSHLKEITALKESHVAEQRLVRVKSEERASAKLSKLEMTRDETMDKLGESRQRSAEDEDATAAATLTKEAEDQKSRELQAKSDELQILRDPFLRLQSQLPKLFQLGKAFAEASARQHGLSIVENCCLADPNGVVAKFLQATPTGLPDLASGRVDPFVWVHRGCPSGEGVRGIFRDGFDTERRWRQLLFADIVAPRRTASGRFEPRSCGGAVIVALVRPDQVEKENGEEYFVVDNPTTSDGGTYCLPVLALHFGQSPLPPCGVHHLAPRSATASVPR